MKKEDTADNTGSERPDLILRSLNRIAKHYTIYPARSAAFQDLIVFFKAAYAGEFNSAGYKDDKKINSMLTFCH
jgi:hypothetical protein